MVVQIGRAVLVLCRTHGDAREAAQVPLFEEQGERVGGAFVAGLEAAVVHPEVDLDEVSAVGDCGVREGLAVAGAMGDEGRTRAAWGQCPRPPRGG